MAGDYPPKQPPISPHEHSNQVERPDHGDAPPLPYAPPESGGSSSNSKVGCWIAGCLGSLFLGVMLIAALGFGGYWWVSQQVEKYTDAEPAPMPAVQMEAEEIAELQNEVDSFFTQVMPDSKETGAEESAEGEELSRPQELVLTAGQINALIQSNKTFADRAYIEIEDGRILAKVTIPTDQIPGGAGRHFNADAEIDVSLENGILLIQIVDAEVKGEPLPEEFANELAKQNLAKELYENAETAKVLQRFESVEVVDNTVRMRLKSSEKQRLEATDDTSPPQPSKEDTLKEAEPSAEEALLKEPIDQSEIVEPAR